MRRRLPAARRLRERGLDRAGRVSFVHQGAFRSTADLDQALRRYASQHHGAEAGRAP
jgi:hypothetical protein